MEYTGSKYTGDTKHDRLEGEGNYTLPTKSHYVGQLKDGMFHGHGTLHLSDGKKFTGEWENGMIIKGQLIFADGLSTYEADQSKWPYCSKNDRRYYTEICNGLKPSGRSEFIDERPDWNLPEGFYDTGDGFYNPDERAVFDYNMRFRRHAGTDEHNWILYACRKGLDEYSAERKAKKKVMLEIIKDENK